MRDSSEIKANVITAIPNMMAPIYRRKNYVKIHYSRMTIILGIIFGTIFIIALFDC